MDRALDTIHHLAIQVSNIENSVKWYKSHFTCDIAYQDKSWALLNFANISLALVLPNQHPTHFAITREDISIFGNPVKHRDGTCSVYVEDPSGNSAEMLQLSH